VTLRPKPRRGIKKTAMIIVAGTLRDIPASKLYDQGFSHEYRMHVT